MKLLLDLFPILLFFITYILSKGNIFLATAVTMVASVGQIIWLILRRQSISKMLWFSALLVLVTGSITLYFHNATFIKWKPTLLYWGFALALLFSQIVQGKNLIRTLLEKQLTLPEPVWAKLQKGWVFFFIIMGIINLLVAFQLSEAAWVYFKPISIGLNFLFIIFQARYLSPYLPDQTDTPPSAE